jgi:ATP phosphoribosyltransferase
MPSPPKGFKRRQQDSLIGNARLGQHQQHHHHAAARKGIYRRKRRPMSHAIDKRIAEPKPQTTAPLVMALPKGRILEEVRPLLTQVGIIPEPAFDDEKSRQLTFATNQPGLTLIRVRAFDVATFVAFGAAHLGVAGSDVLLEFEESELYAPLDLGIGHCRLVVAELASLKTHDNPHHWSHIRVATKYPRLTQRYFAARGVSAECIKLNGALELAPSLGLAARIVDLVSSGATLRANGLVEVEEIAEVSSRLIVNRTALKTQPQRVGAVISLFQEAVNACAS